MDRSVKSVYFSSEHLVVLSGTQEFCSSGVGKTLCKQHSINEVINSAELPADLRHLSLCVITPQFSYRPHSSAPECAHLRASKTHLPREVIHRLERKGPCGGADEFVFPKENTSISTQGIIVLWVWLYQLLQQPGKDHVREKEEMFRDDMLLRHDWNTCVVGWIQRLQQHFHHYRALCFMGPGTWDTFERYHQQKSVDALVSSLLIDHQTDVWWAPASDAASAEWLLHVISAIEKCYVESHLSAFKSRGTRQVGTATTELEKRWLNQLVEIPGIELASARAIAQRFPSPYDLMQFLAKHDVQMQRDTLAAINVPRRGHHKAKKLGIALALRIQRIFTAHAQPMDWVIVH